MSPSPHHWTGVDIDVDIGIHIGNGIDTGTDAGCASGCKPRTVGNLLVDPALDTSWGTTARRAAGSCTALARSTHGCSKASAQCPLASRTAPDRFSSPSP